MVMLDLLRELTETAGPSASETKIASAISGRWKPFVDELNIDRLGSLIAVKHGQGTVPRPRILFAAHMDEIALMVREIIPTGDGEQDGGFIRATNIGGVDKRQLLGQIVTVHSSSGHDHTGIIGALPTRMLPESKRKKPYGFDALNIDLGMTFEELQNEVSVGDFISFRQPLRELLNGRVTAKALDNRASVAAVTLCLEILAERRHEWDVVAIATVQEETRLLGAFTAAFTQRPDLALAIDVTFGKGPGASDEMTFELGGGPTIGFGPNIHPGMYEALKESAKSLEMNVHTEPHAHGSSGTDAFALQVARDGIPTGLVSIPIRYMHTMVETVALVDIERTGRLLAEFVTRLDENFLDGLIENPLDRKD